LNTQKDYKLLQEQNIILAYKGSVSRDLLDTLLRLIDDKIAKIELSAVTRRKVYTIVVELLQNIYHHFGVDNEVVSTDLDSIMFILSKKEGNYRIVTGNHVPRKEVSRLKHKIDEVNKMTLEELKNYYKAALSNGEFSDKGGAGLGIIDIARRAEKKLEYEFEDTHEDFTYFTLIVNIA
jgi:hypothetical protein